MKKTNVNQEKAQKVQKTNTKAGAIIEVTREKEQSAPGAEEQSAKETARKAKEQKKARADRAKAIAGRIQEDAQSVSGIIADIWRYINTEEGAPAIQVADANAIKEDFCAVTGLEQIPATRREFARVWLDMVHKYATATNEEGRAVSITARAGMVWAEGFRPSVRSVWAEVVTNWVRGLSPMVLSTGVYYTRKGRELSKVKQTEARARLKEYETRQAVAREGAKAGRADALRKYEGAKAIEKA
jgi:hypothetical protein